MCGRVTTFEAHLIRGCRARCRQQRRGQTANDRHDELPGAHFGRPEVRSVGDGRIFSRSRCAILRRPGIGLDSRLGGRLTVIPLGGAANETMHRRVGSVVDGFSRKVLAIAVAPTEPSALFAVRLLRQAIREFGPPTGGISDHGKQFTSKEFCRELRRHGIRHRYGAVHQHGSVSIIERWWKSMKNEFAHGLILFRPLPAIHKKLLGYVTWFNGHRPHQGLGQRTPDEVYFGRDTRARAVPMRGELVAQLLDDDRSLPELRLRHAA